MHTHRLRSMLRCYGVQVQLDLGQSCLPWTFRRHKSSCLSLNNIFKCYDLESSPAVDVELSRNDALAMYTQMLEARRLEILSDMYYKQRLIRGFCHLYTGQEAVAVGMKARIRKQDSVITAYRCHPWAYVMGVPLYEIMAELFGFRTGVTRGKGGSMHMYCDNFYGGNGIVGAQVSVGTGVALAHKYRQDGGVCFTLYGDGAANQGQVFESFNMAKLWCLPVVFVCENNHYGMGTKANRASAMTEFYMRGQYIPGLWVDGNQVLAVRSATQFALDYALKHGPIVLEMNTYRYVGHSMSDPGTSYRTRDEIQEARNLHDPITNFREQILDLCLSCEEELKELEEKTKQHVDTECKRALSDKEVALEELHTDAYSKNCEPKIRGVSGYNLEHIRLADVCFGKPKKTPLSEINEVPEAGEKPGGGGKPSSGDDTKAKTEVKTKSEAKTKAEVKTKSEAKPKDEVKTKSEAKIKDEVKTKPQTEPKAAAEPKKQESSTKAPAENEKPVEKAPVGAAPAPSSSKTAQKE